MKLKVLSLIALTILAGASSACYRPEVRASRSNRAPEPPVNSKPPANTDGPSNASIDNRQTGPANSKPMEEKKTGFRANLPSAFVMPSDAVGQRLLAEYGSVCLAAGGALAPEKILYRDEQEVANFQAKLSTSSETIGGFNVVLQKSAMDALKRAIDEARAKGLDITPRGADSAKRTYAETVKLWESRVTPGLAHWVSKGRLPAAEADRIKSLAPFEQVPEILKLEGEGLYFSKDLSKSILYSVAAPGASQHLYLLALDIEQFADRTVREILARHGWFQTVQSDLPHFTYLGATESELPAKGLKAVTVSGQKFWVPSL